MRLKYKNIYFKRIFFLIEEIIFPAQEADRQVLF